MENRLTRIREILNRLTDANGTMPMHSGKHRFWNLSRDEFVNGPIHGRKPIEVGKPADSFLVKILRGDADGLQRMPMNGPGYISDVDLAFIEKWIEDGAPDVAREVRELFGRNLLQVTEDLLKIARSSSDDPIEGLKVGLREAIRIELFTIPPYLTAMWSIDSSNHGDPDRAYDAVMSVAMEEMLHFGIVSNILAGISEPHEIVDYRAYAPKYPGEVPAGARPGLTVSLRKLDRAQFSVFTEVESFSGSASGVDTIGEFYAALAAAFSFESPVLALSRQVELAYGGKPWLRKLSTSDVLGAIELIRRQGEGRPGAHDPWEDPLDHSKGMGHYFQFGEFYHERRYVEAGGVWGFSGPSVRLPAVTNMGDIPMGGFDPNAVVPAAKAPLLAFRSEYVSILDQFTEAWSINPAAIGDAVLKMYSLESFARTLMSIRLPATEETYGPDFLV